MNGIPEPQKDLAIVQRLLKMPSISDWTYPAKVWALGETLVEAKFALLDQELSSNHHWLLVLISWTLLAFSRLVRKHSKWLSAITDPKVLQTFVCVTVGQMTTLMCTEEKRIRMMPIDLAPIAQAANTVSSNV